VSEYLESKLEIERWHRSVPANIMMNTALLFIYGNCLQKHGHMTEESKWLPDLKEVGEGQQEDSGHGVPVEDEDGGAGALVEGRLGEYVHAGVDQPDEHHGGVNLAVDHGGCWVQYGVSVSTAVVVSGQWLPSSLYILDGQGHILFV
jgi:hypothetical protein